MKNRSECKLDLSVIAIVIGLVLTFTASAGTANTQTPKQTAVRQAQTSPAPAGAVVSTLLISEYRLRGPNGATDEYVELENPANTPLTVTVTDASTGWAVAASDGITRFVVPTGTIIPAKGHYLGTNSVGYSLGGYAAGDVTFATEIPDNAGFALFNTSIPANFALATRLDAVGTTSEANTLYKEGTGIPALTPFSIDYAFVRDSCGKGGSIPTLGQCPSGGNVVDTNNNAADFYFVDTNGTSAGAGQRLGAPGPENLAGPINHNSNIVTSLIFPCISSTLSPNRVRDFTSDPANNSTFGTLEIRRAFTNNTGSPLTNLRFRVIDITTFPAPSGIADLRPRTSVATSVANPCGGPAVNLEGTTLEQPPSQPNGGGFNSSLAVGAVTPAPPPADEQPKDGFVIVPVERPEGTIHLDVPLPAGSAINIRFLLGIQQTGNFKFYLNVEALP